MPRILIIEDDLALSRGLKDNFACEGFEVDLAFDGVTGLELALDKGPDLVLLDLMLPRLDGFAVCKAIRRENLDMPIVMLTAKNREQDIVRGLDLGADDYVTKPFSIRELIARVKAFLRRHRPLDGRQAEFGDCTLDLESQRFAKRGEEIKLTRKEFDLLKLFLENESKALTRQRIMDRVWGSGLLVTQRSVDRCVTTLRSKLEDDPGCPRFIKTIRDVGYRFEKKATSS